MGTIAKVVLWFFGGLLALVAVVAAGLFFMDWNLLRSTVNERASAASGRNVEIRGDLHVDLWSWTPEVAAQNVVFGNPPWASEPDMLRVAEVYLKFSLMPIFAGRLEVERLRLVQPQLALERRDGKANWQLEAATPSEAAVEAAAPTEREDFPVLKHLTVEDASLTFRDADLAEPIEVELANLTVEAGGLEDPVSLKAEGSYLDRPFMLQGEGESFEKFRSTDEPYDLTLDARIGDTRLTARGSLDEPVQLAGVDATLDLQGENLHELFTLFALPLPESPPYAIAGRLAREGDRWALRDLEGRLGESDLRGTVEVATGGERPQLTADVTSNAFRAEDLEGFWGEEEAGEEQAADAAADDGHILSDEPLSLPKLRRMDAQVRFSGKSIESGALRLQDLSADLRLDDGLLTITPLELGLAEGRITADLRLDGREEFPKMAGDVTVEGLDVNALLALLGQENAAAGLLQGRLRMTMQGRSMRELGGSATGEGALIMSGGRIENLLLELIALDLQEAVGQWLADDRSQVEVLCLAMPTRIESGRFTADPWILDTTDAIVTVTGYVDLGTEQVQIELEPHPKDFSLFNYLTSIEVTGDLSERTAATSPIEAVGKLLLKTLAVPVMPLLSGSIQESAQEQSEPCPSLRQRLEAAMAEGGTGVPAASDATDGGNAEGSDADDAAAEGTEAPQPPDGAAIARIQSALNAAGFNLTVDGIAGPDTEAALREFQERENLQPSGRADAATLRRLRLAPEN